MKKALSTATALLLLAAVLAGCGGQQPAAAPATEAAAATTEAAAPEAATTEAAAETTEAAAAAPETAATGLRTFVVDPSASKASYLVDEEFLGGALDKLGIAAGAVDVVGSTQEIEGQLQLNLNDLSAALGDNSFTVKMNTLTTDQDRRDNFIRENGPKFDQFPVATFKATAIEGAPASYTDGEEVSFKMIGDLTVRDVTKPITFDVKAAINGDTLTGTATANTKMSEFGIEPPNFANTLTVADAFGIEVQITAKEQN
ncbi:MAG: YceI family protein [Anaerolineales bacterium]|nr:YceI family protein [Anaerolineales bacterium]